MDNTSPIAIMSSVGNMKVYFGDDNILMLQNINVADTERAQTEYSTNSILHTVLGNGLLDSSTIEQLYNQVNITSTQTTITSNQIKLTSTDNASVNIVSPVGFYYPALNFYNGGTNLLGSISGYGGALYIGGAGGTPLIVSGTGVIINNETANTLTYLDSGKYLKSVTLGAGLSLSSGTLSATATTPSLSSVLAVGNTSGANDIVMNTTRVIKSANGGGELGLDGGSYGITGSVYLTNDNNGFGKSFLSFDDTLYGYKNYVSLTACDTSTNSLTGSINVGIYSSNVSAYKALLTLTSTISQIMFKTANISLIDAQINLNATTSIVSGILRMNANTASTLAYHDTSKNIKSATLGSGLSLSTGTLNLSTAIKTGTFGITVDGAGSVPVLGVKNYIVVPYNCIITGWEIIANTTGNVVVDVWKHTSIPTVGNSITGIDKPRLVAQQINSNNTLTTWSTTVNAGDIIAFNIDSISTIHSFSVFIKNIKI